MKIKGAITGITARLKSLQRLGAGASVDVYLLGKTDAVAILKDPDSLTDNQWELLASHKYHQHKLTNGVCWISEILLDTNGQRVGYRMPLVGDSDLTVLSDMSRAGSAKLDLVIAVCKSMCRIFVEVEALASPEWIPTDQKLNNWRWKSGTPDIGMIDTVSGISSNFRSVLSGKPISLTPVELQGFRTPGYIAPELLHTPSMSWDKNVNRWCLAVILFEIVKGSHPYVPTASMIAHDWDEDTGVLSGVVPLYGGSLPPPKNVLAAPRHADSEVLWMRAFQCPPDKRPSPTEWLRAFESWELSLRPVPVPPAQIIYVRPKYLNLLESIVDKGSIAILLLGLAAGAVYLAVKHSSEMPSVTPAVHAQEKPSFVPEDLTEPFK